jgi:hypothetical protein
VPPLSDVSCLEQENIQEERGIYMYPVAPVKRTFTLAIVAPINVGTFGLWIDYSEDSLLKGS